MALVPALDVRVVTCPGFEPSESALARLTFGGLQERRCNSLTLPIRVHSEMPDHPAASWPVGEPGAVALEIEKPDDLASVVGHELDSRLLIALLLALDRVEERGVEEREHAAPQPTSLVGRHVWANHDAHATSLAGQPRAIKLRTMWRTKIPMLQAGGSKNGRVAVQRMDNVGIVVESLDAAISFFTELGLELEGRAMIEEDWSGRVTGLRDQRVEIAMMRTPDGHGRIELSRFLAPPVVADHRDAPVNAFGYLRVMFAVDDLDETLDRLRGHGAQLVDEVVQYEDVYRLCYVRGPEGILIGLAEQIG